MRTHQGLREYLLTTERINDILLKSYQDITSKGWVVMEVLNTEPKLPASVAGGFEMHKTYLLARKVRKEDIGPDGSVLLDPPTINFEGNRLMLPAIELTPLGILIKGKSPLDMLLGYTDFERSLKTIPLAPSKPTYSRVHRS